MWMLFTLLYSEYLFSNLIFFQDLTNDGHDILTQLPLPSTVTGFCRLVTQFNVGLIVAFDLDSSKSDEVRLNLKFTLPSIFLYKMNTFKSGSINLDSLK